MGTLKTGALFTWASLLNSMGGHIRIIEIFCMLFWDYRPLLATVHCSYTPTFQGVHPGFPQSSSRAPYSFLHSVPLVRYILCL